jgi:hypothetical protein
VEHIRPDRRALRRQPRDAQAALRPALPGHGVRAIDITDRGYIDYARRYVLHQAGAFFVSRANANRTEFDAQDNKLICSISNRAGVKKTASFTQLCSPRALGSAPFRRMR